jgi:hypothetical protein
MCREYHEVATLEYVSENTFNILIGSEEIVF